MEEDAKIRFLFKKIENQGLNATIGALKVCITTGGPGSVSYTTAANHLSTAVSKLPEYVAKHNRNVSSLGKGNNGQISGIYGSDGKIIIGTTSNWHSLLREEKAKVFAERKHLGIKYNKGATKDKGESKGKSSKEIDKIEKKNSKLKMIIKALKKKV
eukprot:13488085-Ditylum_brightwellii.AAC.1